MPEHFDVLIVGAGISGIGSAWHLSQQCPDKSFAILEGRDAIGGTWDLFRYPGIRSDSDMYTLGYNFKPWLQNEVIANGGQICNYIEEAAVEGGFQNKIHFGRKVVSASWSSETATWTLDVLNKSGETQQMSCNWLMMCSGYYNYEQGYTPEFKGRDDFKGQIIHPQFWPEQLDYSGKRVVVIGSGATAITLIPSMTDTAQHVVMLQRTPSYLVSVPQFIPVLRILFKLMPKMTAYNISRSVMNFITQGIFKLSRKYPNLVRKLMLKGVKFQVGSDFDMKHFTPPYKPWDQRLCAVPDGDMFKAISSGKASVVTEHIDRFVEDGILLKSGKVEKADIIVTATGLNLRMFGGLCINIDGEPVDIAKHITYKGMMLNDVPNFSYAMGYSNASWTLKIDLTAEYACRLISHMDKTGTRIALARRDSHVKEVPFMDLVSGYISRAEHLLPKSADREPWKIYNNYNMDKKLLRNCKLEDGVMTFDKPHKVVQI